MINKVKFTVNTSYDGTAIYEIYSGSTCNVGGTLITSGTTEVIDGVSDVIVDNVDLNDDMSVRVIDSIQCETCESFNVTFANCTPFSGTAEYIATIPVVNPDVYYDYTSNGFGTGSFTIDYIAASNNQPAQLDLNHTDTQNSESSTGNLAPRGGTNLEIAVTNTSQIKTVTSLVISKNGAVVYNSGNTVDQPIIIQFAVANQDVIAITAVTDGDNPLAP